MIPIEDDYDLDRNVALRDAILAHYRLLSESVYATCDHRRDVAYGKQPSERFDVFPAQLRGPVVLFFHGGWWFRGDKESRAFLAPPLVAAGCSFVTIEYPLAQECRLDDMVESATLALGAIRDWAATHGGDPTRIYVAGESAGAHLALIAAARAASSVPLAGVVASSGIYDLTELLELRPNSWLCLDEHTASALSPAFATFPPELALTLAVGSREPAGFQRQLDILAARWRGPLKTQVHADDDHFSSIARIPQLVLQLVAQAAPV